jgi:hypothetical protein
MPLVKTIVPVASKNSIWGGDEKGNILSWSTRRDDLGNLEFRNIVKEQLISYALIDESQLESKGSFFFLFSIFLFFSFCYSS